MKSYHTLGLIFLLDFFHAVREISPKTIINLKPRKFRTVPSSPAYPGPGRGGSSLSREAQTALSPATSPSSSGGIPRRSQASREI